MNQCEVICIFLDVKPSLDWGKESNSECLGMITNSEPNPKFFSYLSIYKGYFQKVIHCTLCYKKLKTFLHFAILRES